MTNVLQRPIEIKERILSEPRCLDPRPIVQSEIAWALAQAVRPRLTGFQRVQIYIALGAGDTFVTIANLIRFALAEHILVDEELIDDVERWLDGYAGTEPEAELRKFSERLRQPSCLYGCPGLLTEKPRICSTTDSLDAVREGQV